MSWSFNAIGTPAKILVALDAESQRLKDQCKIEFDAALPHIKALVSENFNNQMSPDMTLVQIEAYGSGYTADGKVLTRACSVSVKPYHNKLLI